jgi:hypothetical protein
MPDNTSHVDYSSLLSESERRLLTGIESHIASTVWRVHNYPRVCWTAWQDENRRVVYVLINCDHRSEIIAYYNENENRRLTKGVVEKDTAFGHRRHGAPGFSERTGPKI